VGHQNWPERFGKEKNLCTWLESNSSFSGYPTHTYPSHFTDKAKSASKVSVCIELKSHIMAANIQ